MTTILQISDPHLSRPDTLVSGKLDTASTGARLVERIREIAPLIGSIDAILVSGDVSDDGSEESYALFRSLTQGLPAPVFVIPGNHDARGAMRSAFADDGYLPREGKLNWRRRIGDVELIGLDTLIEGEGGGELDAETLEFLRAALEEANDAPVLLALHHPPFPTGIRFMDRIGLAGADRLAASLAAHRGALRVVCGHIHSVMIAEVGGKVALSAPSPASSFQLDYRADAPVGFMTEEDGFMVHVWRNGFVSTRVAMARGDGPFPF